MIWYRIFLFLALLAAAGIVGRLDFEDEQIEHAHYCEMVKDGYWPAFKGECQK